MSFSFWWYLIILFYLSWCQLFCVKKEKIVNISPPCLHASLHQLNYRAICMSIFIAFIANLSLPMNDFIAAKKIYRFYHISYLINFIRIFFYLSLINFSIIKGDTLHILPNGESVIFLVLLKRLWLPNDSYMVVFEFYKLLNNPFASDLCPCCKS